MLHRFYPSAGFLSRGFRPAAYFALKKLGIVEVHRCSYQTQGAQGALAVLVVVRIGTGVVVREVAFENAIDEYGEFARGGGDGALRVDGRRARYPYAPR